ncbi:cation transporting ATPase C-terminal domain-containing protein [Streptomyces sp. FXJ1.4098]|nr:cation transporting ATPase C-terminal domain-containing protein [Streptomyces sp. FXJ1.4098]
MWWSPTTASRPSSMPSWRAAPCGPRSARRWASCSAATSGRSPSCWRPPCSPDEARSTRASCSSSISSRTCCRPWPSPPVLRRAGPRNCSRKARGVPGRALTRHIRLRATLTALAAGCAWAVARATGTRARADTVSLVALVASQLLQTLADAGRDPVVALAAVGSLVALGLVVALPGLSHFFGSRPLGPAGWTIGLAAAAAPVVLPAAWHFLTARVRSDTGTGMTPRVHLTAPCTPCVRSSGTAQRSGK